MADTGTPIDGAVAIVTGGNRGLGQALVAELLEQGASKVYATARRPFTTEDPRVVPLVLDVTDDAAVNRVAQTANDVSIVINNAGVTLRTPLLEAPFDQIQAELDTNLFGVLRVTRAFAPVLAEHDRSALVNILSVLSWISFGSGYEVSKAAAWSATNALRTALQGQGTTVTGLHVGYMDTDMTAGVDAPKLDPRDVAKLAVDAIAAGDYEVLADDISRQVKAGLAAPIETLYEQLVSV
jgi:NAD(P)-dependent dehydrogenase (short-subunit alcohol dehydrogenase family)